MIRGGKGGRIPARHGLRFEKRMDLAAAISKVPGYSVRTSKVFFKGKHVATLYKKHKLYSDLLVPNRINYKTMVSKRLVPDDAMLVQVRNTLFVIEIKFQTVSGSVDEKLQTCDFKLKQYQKLLAPLSLQVKYVYVLNDWFKQKSYADVLAYIKSVKCDYFFNVIPFEYFGLPTP